MLNKVIMLGRISSSPKSFESKNHVSVTNFSVAVDTGWGDSSRTDFFECTAFGKTSDFIASNFTKGQLILLEGSLQNQDSVGKDGTRYLRDKIIVSNVSFAGYNKSDFVKDGVDYE